MSVPGFEEGQQRAAGTAGGFEDLAGDAGEAFEIEGGVGEFPRRLVEIVDLGGNTGIAIGLDVGGHENPEGWGGQVGPAQCK
jgi:hypothetical protein